MRSVILALVLTMAGSLTARAQSCVPVTVPDWVASIPVSSSSVRLWPADCATVEQSPPDFSWPDLSADAQYRVSLTYPDGRVRTLAAPQNWINWDEALPAGSYAWQIQATNSSGTASSNARRFAVGAGAVAFVVPDWATLFSRATSKGHPRALPDAATGQVMIAQRQAGFATLRARVDGTLTAALPREPNFADPVGAVTELANAESKRMLASALAWLVSSNQAYLADALRRAQNLASWDPHGSTGYANVDEGSSVIAGTLALVYDWLYPWLDADQKSRLLAAILPRATDMYNDVIGSRARVAVRPYDSHGNITLSYLAVISILLAGDVPQAANGLRDALPLAIHWTSPWGLEDGGFGNGTAYATWTTGNLLIAWYALRWTVGVDLAQKSWVRNYANLLAYFIPPGTPAGAFGDSAEAMLVEAWARFGKAYALFAPSPLARWYAAQLRGEDSAGLELLLAPPADQSPAPYPAGVPNAVRLSSIGWAALHSDLADPARVSVYFKSSPYGSYNHSHADQNSFVVNAAGQPLAIDSGYYDGYMTPHWWQWYKQTRAHNAITFDGGQGQSVYEGSGQLGPGAMTGFTHRPDYGIVQGDATQAYGGALSRAQRSLVYLRPDLLLVYDNLASATPRQWEWNVHALEAMRAISDTQISIARNGRSLCIDMLAGPPTRFAQTSQFTVDPVAGFAWVPQWHGAFTSTSPSASAEFIALLRVGCAATAAAASKANGAWTVLAGGRTVTIGDTGAISVQ
jgi:hypothetical protein